MTRPILTHTLETLAQAAEPKSKYRNRKVVVDGFTFDSAKEARHWSNLRLLQRAGKIRNLRRQVPYPLVVIAPDGTPVTIAKLVVDFDYEDEAGQLVVEDTKSAFTRKLPVYRLKAKHFAAQYGFPVREV